MSETKCLFNLKEGITRILELNSPTRDEKIRIWDNGERFFLFSYVNAKGVWVYNEEVAPDDSGPEIA